MAIPVMPRLLKLSQNLGLKLLLPKVGIVSSTPARFFLMLVLVFVTMQPGSELDQ